MLSGHILVHRVPLTSFGHKLHDLCVSVVPPPLSLMYCVAPLRYTSFTYIWYEMSRFQELLAYPIHIDVASYTFKRVPVYIVNVLNIVNLQTYFLYVCYIAIFLLADQSKLRRVEVWLQLTGHSRKLYCWSFFLRCHHCDSCWGAFSI